MNKLLLILVFSLGFHNVNAQHQHDKKNTVTNPLVADTDHLNQLYNHYLGIKDALVAGKEEDAAKHANKFSQTASVISYRDLAEGNVNALRKDASAIADSRDLTTQRKAFSNLSANMLLLVEQFKISSKTVYLQHCPMANAYWLANEEEIKNPYYGSSMLNCGLVKKTF